MICTTTVPSQATENVIFEQIGTLSGSTSYLHTHVTINISAIEIQYNTYRDFLQAEISRTQTDLDNVAVSGSLYGEDYKVRSQGTSLEQLEEILKYTKLTYEQAVQYLASIKRFPRNFDGADENAIRKSDEYKWRTSQLNQNAADAVQGMVHHYRITQARDARDNAARNTKQIWHKIALLHWNDLMDIGLHLAAVKELLPTVHAGDRQRILATDYMDNIRPRAQNVVYDDLQLEARFFHDEDERGTKRFRRSTLSPWNHQNNPNLTLFDTNDEPILQYDHDQNDPVFSILDREKRFVVGAAALAVATAATAVGVYNGVQIEFLKYQLTEVKENTRRLFEIADLHEHQLRQVEVGINLISIQLAESLQNDPALYDSRLSRIENQIRDRLRSTTHALQAAQHNRLAVDYLSPNLIRRLFPQLETTAKEFDCELLAKLPSDLYQLDTSLLFDGTNAHLLLHIPMVPKQSLLRLFRLHPFPLPFFDTHFLIPNVKNDILAVSSTASRLHVQLSSADLTGCHKMGTTYLCDRFGVLFRNFSNTCMGALYDQKFDTAKQLCDFHIEPVTERIYSLRKNQFMLYLTEAITAPMTCQGKTGERTSMEKHLGRGSQRFQLPAGCVARFNDHVVYSDMAIKMPAETLHFQWNWASLDMFNEPAVKVDDELLRLQSFGINRPSLASLGLTMSTATSTWVSNVKIAIAVVTGIMVVIGIAVCLNCCYRHRHKSEEIPVDIERGGPIIRCRPTTQTTEYTSDTETATDIYSYNTPTPVVHRRRPHRSNTLPAHRNSKALTGDQSQTLPPHLNRISHHEDPPSYKSIEEPSSRRPRSGTIQSMSLPRPPEPRSEDFVSCANRNWTTN